MNEITLVPGDIIVYRYQNEDEYAIWNGDGTRTLIGDSDALLRTKVLHDGICIKAIASKRIVRCVWKGDQCLPRKIES